jgi:hypothetical protein
MQQQLLQLDLRRNLHCFNQGAGLNMGLKYVNEARELRVLQLCNACFAFILARKTIVVKELSVKEWPTS